MPISRYCLLRIADRWPGERIQALNISRGVPSVALPQAMFSAARQHVALPTYDLFIRLVKGWRQAVWEKELHLRMSAAFEEAELPSFIFPLKLRRPTCLRAKLVRQSIARIAASLPWMVLMFSPGQRFRAGVSRPGRTRGETGEADETAGTRAKTSTAIKGTAAAMRPFIP